MRALFASSEVYRLFLLNYRAQGVSGENEQPAKHHSAGPPEARGPIQLHRLHRLKADPDFSNVLCSTSFLKSSRKTFFPLLIS